MPVKRRTNACKKAYKCLWRDLLLPGKESYTNAYERLLWLDELCCQQSITTHITTHITTRINTRITTHITTRITANACTCWAAEQQRKAGAWVAKHATGIKKYDLMLYSYFATLPTYADVSIRQHTAACVSVRQKQEWYCTPTGPLILYSYFYSYFYSYLQNQAPVPRNMPYYMPTYDTPSSRYAFIPIPLDMPICRYASLISTIYMNTEMPPLLRLHADVCWRMLTYADVCWHMLTYADICWHMHTYLQGTSTNSRCLRWPWRAPLEQCLACFCIAKRLLSPASWRSRV